MRSTNQPVSSGGGAWSVSLSFGDSARRSSISDRRIVAKTIAADVERSVQILGRLLEPDNFAEHADKELYWLTSEFDPLCEHATEFLVDIYRAAFGNPPPSRDEVTNLGDSRILSLTSNRQQDYEMILYRLAKKFPDFVARQPVNAAKALIATVEGHVALNPDSPDGLPF